MNRLQLAEQLPYEFLEPKVGRFWLWLGRLYARRSYLKEHRSRRSTSRGSTASPPRPTAATASSSRPTTPIMPTRA